MMVLDLLATFGTLIWVSILILPWRPWSTRERLDANVADTTDLSEVTVLIPARNEEEEIGKTLSALKDQSPDLKVILVDDQSTDKTKEKALCVGLTQLQILDGTELPGGWSGKLWALEQGRKQIQTPLTLLIDADIELKPGILKSMLKKMKDEDLSFLSLMAHLQMKSLWEKILIPAFIYFFKLLYPFHWGNSPKTKFGVAAGGFILVKTEIIEEMGGFRAIQGALIDDCSFAKQVKRLGKKTWMGLTHDVTSHRGYDRLKPIWNMVARTAYTQLLYSPLLLIGCSFALFCAFILLPLGLILSPTNVTFWVGLLAMFFSYLPTIRFYRLPLFWTFALLPAGVLYILMTWTSAYRYYRGQRSEWKGRVYAKNVTKMT